MIDIDPITGPYAAAAGLLLVAAVAKVVNPTPTARALRTAGVPAPAWLVRVLALVEGGLAVGALVVPSVALAAAIGVSYAGFAVFVAWAMARGIPLSSCGCIGEIDTPPTLAHVVLNGAAAAVAFAVAGASASSPPPAIASVVVESPGVGIPLVAMTAVSVFLATVVMGPLAQVTVARRAGRRVSGAGSRP